MSKYKYETYLYAERDTIALGQSFCDHMDHMTGEQLHDKAEIAAELAYRDNCIAELQAQLDDIKLRHSVLKDIHNDNNRDYRERIEKEIDDFIAEEQSHS